MATGKTELAKSIAEKTGLTRSQTLKVLDAFVETVGDKISNGDKVQLTGFGTFMARKRASREGRNPRTGAPITIPASVTPAFKAGKQLKERVKS